MIDSTLPAEEGKSAAEDAPAHPPITPSPKQAEGAIKVNATATKGRGLIGWLFAGVWVGTIVLGGFCAGLILQKRFFQAKADKRGNSNVQVSISPEQATLEDIVAVFGIAEKTISIYAGKPITSRRILDAIIARSKSGIRVSIILSTTYAPSASAKVPTYLSVGGVSEIWIDRASTGEQYAILDGNILIQSDSPWVASRPESVGTTFFIRDPKIAAAFSSRFTERAAQSLRIR